MSAASPVTIDPRIEPIDAGRVDAIGPNIVDAEVARPIDAFTVEAAAPIKLGTLPNQPPYVEPPAAEPPTLADAKLALAQWGAQASSIAVIQAVDFSTAPYPVYGAQTTATIVATTLLRGASVPRTVQYIGGTIGELTYRPSHEFWLDPGRRYLARFDGMSLSGLRILDARGMVTELGFTFDLAAMKEVLYADN